MKIQEGNEARKKRDQHQSLSFDHWERQINLKRRERGVSELKEKEHRKQDHEQGREEEENRCSFLTWGSRKGNEGEKAVCHAGTVLLQGNLEKWATISLADRVRSVYQKKRSIAWDSFLEGREKTWGLVIDRKQRRPRKPMKVLHCKGVHLVTLLEEGGGNALETECM